MSSNLRKSSLGWKVMAILGLGLGLSSASAIALDANTQSSSRDHVRNVKVVRTKAADTSINWQPSVGDTWQIVLQNPIKVTSKTISPNVQVWDLDVFDNDASTFTTLHSASKKVICYFSAGSYENWRPDKNKFMPSDIGNSLDGWPGESWIDIRSTNVRRIMKKRIALAASKGCDAIDPDNVDGYETDTGFDLTADDAIDYIKFLARTAASFGLATGLKNAGDLVPDVLSSVQFAVIEQCVEYSECGLYKPFIKAGKPVFQIEYPKGAGSKVSSSSLKKICGTTGAAAGSKGFSKAIKKMSLDGWVQYCGSSKTYNTKVED